MKGRLLMKEFDTIIIGSGPGGMAVAEKLASSQKVLIIEQAEWGGTCPNRGCDPKKMMSSVVATYLQAKRYAKDGITDVADLNWGDLMTFKKSYTDRVPSGMKAGLEAAGATTLSGQAHFVDPHTIEVNGETYRGEHVVIATGGKPAVLPIPGKEYLSTSDDFLDLAALPATIGFIGGGVISLELASIASAAGAKVHIFQRDQTLLPMVPKRINDLLVQALEVRDVMFHFDTEVASVVKTVNGLSANTNNGTVEVDMLISAIGRPAAIDELALQAGDIAFDRHGVVVNDHLQTNHPNVYALGDVVSAKRPKLTSLAQLEGNYVADQILGVSDEPLAEPVVPFTIFANPQVGQVGMTVAEAQKQPERYTITETPVGSWYNYMKNHDDDATVVTIVDQTTGLLVGAAMIAFEVAAMMNLFGRIIEHKQTKAQVAASLNVYPSVASDLPYLY